jgi:hypothetical protein
MRERRVFGWLLLSVLACGPVPGGRLAGEVASVPKDPPGWSSVLPDGKGFCEIESRPADPHSIQLECFVDDGELLVQSHRWAYASWWPVESWAEIWIDHPDVRVRIDGSLFELTATRVSDPARREAVLRERGYDPAPDGIALFRFDPRAADQPRSLFAPPRVPGSQPVSVPTTEMASDASRARLP